jgi:hypothetical protein
MPNNGDSSQNEPTAEADPPRRRITINHLARLVASVVLVASVIVVVFLAGFFTERDYGDVFGALQASFFEPLEGSFVPEDEVCIDRVCKPAGRFGQHCRQVVVPC